MTLSELLAVYPPLPPGAAEEVERRAKEAAGQMPYFGVKTTFALIFIPLVIALGEMIHLYVTKLLHQTSAEKSQMVAVLLNLARLAWYFTGAAVLLCNFGLKTAEYGDENYDRFTTVSFRLGVSLFLLLLVHSCSLFILSRFRNSQR